MVKYATAAHDGTETVASEDPRDSPAHALSASSATPPQTSCMPARASAEIADPCRCETTEPAAHDNAAPSSSAIIGGSVAAPPSPATPRQAMSATPARP